MVFQRASKKTVPFPSRPAQPTVVEIVQDIRRSQPNDIVFSIFQNEKDQGKNATHLYLAFSQFFHYRPIRLYVNKQGPNHFVTHLEDPLTFDMGLPRDFMWADHVSYASNGASR